MGTAAKRMDAFEMGQGRIACLLLHGFTASPSQFYPMGEALAARGFHVVCMRLPGHGTTIQEMQTTNWQDWLSAAQSAADHLRETHDALFVVGLSMGGCLALLLGEMGKADAVVSMAAPMHLFGEGMSKLAWLAWPLYRYRKDGVARPRVDFLSAYDFSYDAMPVRKIPDLRKLMHKARCGLASLTCPLLVVQSRADETVKPFSADIIFAQAGSLDKELMMLENSPHVLILGQERERVFARVGDFLEACAQRLQA